MTKHRSPYRILRYPLGIYLYYWKNQWYYFTKPKIKTEIKNILNKTINKYKESVDKWTN